MNLSRLEKVKLNIDLQLVILRHLSSSVNAETREEIMNNSSKCNAVYKENSASSALCISLLVIVPPTAPASLDEICPQ